MAAWVVSTFWLQCVMQPGTFVFRLLCGHVFVSPGDTSKTGIVGWHSNSMFDCLRSCQAVFHSRCIILHPPQEQQRRALLTSGPHPTEPHEVLTDLSICDRWLSGRRNSVKCLFWCSSVMKRVALADEMTLWAGTWITPMLKVNPNLSSSVALL